MRRHDANLTGLIAGVLFIGLGVYGLSVGPDQLADALRWVWPITLLGLGVALLAGSSNHARRTRDGESAGDEPHRGAESEPSGRS
jgi:cytochrome c-type biogenesis protein CcmH/NrfF